jgi:hypothetical protein
MSGDVALSWRLRRVEVEDGLIDATGCVQPFYQKITISSVLAPMDIVVF